MTSQNQDAPVEDLHEVFQEEMKNMEDTKQRLREKVLVKLTSTVLGIGFAGALCYYLGLFLFGVWSITEDGQQCFAMELPDKTQYAKDPLEENFEKYQGL